MPVPTRDTSEAELNQFNAFIRSQPWYQQFFAQRGLNPNKVELSRADQGALEQVMAANGVQVPSGMHIDQAGNLNQKNRLVRNIAVGAAIGGAALTGFGLAGMGPLAGMAGPSTAAATSAIPTIPSAAIGSGLGYGPVSLAGTSVLAGGGTAAIPTIGSHVIGTGLGYGPQSLPSTAGGAAVPFNPGPRLPGTHGGGFGGGVPTGGAFSKLLPYIINTGLQGAGALIAQRQINKAVEAQRQAAAQVAGLAGNVYQQQRADQQPFLNLGTNAAGTLGHLLGIGR